MEAIKKSRPTAKESTLKQYMSHLNKLRKNFEKEYDNIGWKFLEDIESVKSSVSSNVYTSQRNTYNSVIVLLMALNSNNDYDTTIEEYTKMRDELNAQYVKDKSEGKMSEKQENNFVTREEIEIMLQKMYDKIKTEKIKKKTQITNSDRELLTTYTLFHLLLRCPTRNDMAGMKLVSTNDLKKTHDDIRNHQNYLIKTKNGFIMELNEYKTDKTYGRVHINVPSECAKVLRMFLKYTNKTNWDVVFTSSINKPLSRNGITQLLIKCSNEYLNKSVSTTMMRKCVASDLFSQKNKDQEELAKICCHSVEVQNQVYVKK